MEERAELQALQRLRVEAERCSHLERGVRDPTCVRRGVLVLGLERVGERFHGRDERRLEALEAARVRDRELRLVREPGEQPCPVFVESRRLSRRDLGDDEAEAPAVESDRRKSERGSVVLLRNAVNLCRSGAVEHERLVGLGRRRHALERGAQA